MLTRNRVLSLGLLLLVLLAVGLWLSRESTPGEEMLSAYQQALADTAGHTRFPHGSPEEQAAIERFVDFYRNFTSQGVRERIQSTYAETLYFNDTLKTLRTREELEEYMVEAAAAVSSTNVDVQDVSVSDGGYYFRWVMEIRFKKLASGRPTRSIGVSHVRFDQAGKIILHQDHWDSAAGLYEHVPVLGWMIRKVRARL
jgi:hypothetical protein